MENKFDERKQVPLGEQVACRAPMGRASGDTAGGGRCRTVAGGWGDARPGLHLGITVSRQMGFIATGMDDITGEACGERGAQDKVLEPLRPFRAGSQPQL